MKFSALRRLLQHRGCVPLSCRETGVYRYRDLPEGKRIREAGEVARAIALLAARAGYTVPADPFPVAGRDGRRNGKQTAPARAREYVGIREFDKMLSFLGEAIG